MEKTLCTGPNRGSDEGAITPSPGHKTLWNHVEQVRQTSPLVVNITNYVVMNNSANAVLAVGASPVMSHAHSEVEAMVSICGSLVVNIGTLDEYWARTMVRAAREAGRLGKPWLLDPVGAGATPYRDEVLKKLLPLCPTVIRGNASEILALARANTPAADPPAAPVSSAAPATIAPTIFDPREPVPITKGVDSTAASGEAVDAARWLNRAFGSVVCISGETDIVVDGERTVYVHNGSTMMTRVTGLGCSCSAVMGAFIATLGATSPVASDTPTLAPAPAPAPTPTPTPTPTPAMPSSTAISAPDASIPSLPPPTAAAHYSGMFEVVTAAAALFAMAGEIAAEAALGPGSLQVALLDKLYNIAEDEFAARLRVEEHCDVA